MSFAIVGVSSGANGTFSIAGDQTPLFVAGYKFKVFGSTANDGEYTVQSASFSTNTDIIVVETIADGTVDGSIMSHAGYIVDFSDSTKASKGVEPQTFNSTDFSIALPGRGQVNFGETLAENSIHMLENFASPVAPSNPVEGQLWYDTSVSPAQLNVYNGGSFVLAGGTDFVLKAGDTMTGFLTLSADPTSNLHAATKQYIDTHISDGTVHITSDQNTFLDNLDLTGPNPVSATEVNYLGGVTPVTSSVQAQIDDKLPLGGGTLTGDLTLASGIDLNVQGGGTVTGLPSIPVGSFDATSKVYVDNLVTAGTVWRDPITDPDLIGVADTVPSPSTDDTVWIRYGAGTVTWGNIIDVAEGDVMLYDTGVAGSWTRIGTLATGAVRFIIAGEHGSVHTSLYNLGFRNGDLVEWVSGVPNSLASWSFPHDAGYQVIEFNAPILGTDNATGISATTQYDLDVTIDGVLHQLTFATDATSPQKYSDLVGVLNTALNTAYTGANAVVETEGHIHLYSGDGTKVIVAAGTNGAGTDLLAALTDFNQVFAGVENGTTVLVNDPDSNHYGHTYTYTNEANIWYEISGPGAIVAGTHLAYSGNTLNVDFSDGDVYMPNKLGIGYATPDYSLQVHVAAANDSVIHFTNSVTGTASTDGLIVGVDNVADAYLLNRENTNMIFYTNNAERMRITAAGEVQYHNGTVTHNYSTNHSTTTTTSTAVNQTIFSMSAASFRSAEFMIQVSQGANYHMTKILAIHDGTTAYLTEYGTIVIGVAQAVFDVNISGGSVLLQATPTTANSTTFKVVATMITV